MISFTCNICGKINQKDVPFPTEPASCPCGSNVRIRALIHLISLELFGHSIPLADFPKLKAIRALGMSDHPYYAHLLAEKFSYTNTFFDHEPYFDFTQEHPEQWGTYDFILSADVLEHIADENAAVQEMGRLLKPCGFAGITVFCNRQDKLREHFPDLHEYRVVPLGSSSVLINRSADGKLQITDDLVFHGGTGATLELREFGKTSLHQLLTAHGFLGTTFLTENVPELGVLFDADVSQPLLARKDPYVIPKAAVCDLMEELIRANIRGEAEGYARYLGKQIETAEGSRWMRLGRRLGIGPTFNLRPEPKR